MSGKQAEKKWSELFRRVTATGGKPRFSLRGAKDYLYEYNGYSVGHQELDRIIALLEKNGISSDASEEDSPMNVSSYRDSYRFEDGGLEIYAGNYFFGSPGHGAFIVGVKALRWLLDQLGIKQPPKFKKRSRAE
jgi:hypothetical protein